MPYIKQEDRQKIASEVECACYGNLLDVVEYNNIDNGGDMQYAIAVMIKNFMKRKGLNYQHCQDIMGALDGASKEFYRRTVAPYEDSKIEENGDV